MSRWPHQTPSKRIYYPITVITFQVQPLNVSILTLALQKTSLCDSPQAEYRSIRQYVTTSANSHTKFWGSSKSPLIVFTPMIKEDPAKSTCIYRYLQAIRPLGLMEELSLEFYNMAAMASFNHLAYHLMPSRKQQGSRTKRWIQIYAAVM